MTRSNAFPLLCIGLLSATATFSNAVPALAADNVTAFPDTVVQDGQTKYITTEGTAYDSIVFSTVMTNQGTDANLDLQGDDSRLVFSTENGLTFEDGVNVTGDKGILEFNGPVNFILTDKSKSSLETKEIYFIGSDSETPDTINVSGGETLSVGTAKVGIDKNVKISYAGGSSISAIDDLRLAENAATNLSFGSNTVLTAQNTTIGSNGAFITGALHIGTNPDPTMTSGLNTEGPVTIKGDLLIDGKVTNTATTPAFIFDAAKSVIFGEGAAASELADNTQFQLSNDMLRNTTTLTVFTPFDTVQNASPELLRRMRKMSESLALQYDEAVLGGEANYDRNTGQVVFANYKGQDHMAGVPGYGVAYVESLDRVNKNLAIAVKAVAKEGDVNKELNKLMGNVQTAAISAALSGNMNQVMDRLNSTLSTTMPGFAGPSSQYNGLWVSPGYSMTKIDGDQKKGYGDFEVKNPNVTVGYDRWVNDRIRMGVFAAVGRPKTEGDNETIETDNLQVGLYGQALLNYGLNVNMGLGFSSQSHDSERKINTTLLEGYNQMAKASFDSKTISAALEISKLYPLERNAFIRPTVGYSYIKTDMDGYTEKSNVAIASNNLAQKVDDNEFTLHLVRVGAEGGWTNNVTTITGRLFWVGNMGDTQPESKATLVTDSPGALPFVVTGAEYDKNMVNVGVGVRYVPPELRGVTFGLNYDALLGSNSQNHNVSLMVRYEF